MAAYKVSAAELAKVKELLTATQSSASSTTEQIDAAIKAVGDSTAIVESTAAKLKELNQQIAAISAEFGAIQEQQAAMQKRKDGRRSCNA